jgi:hypothetical protein
MNMISKNTLGKRGKLTQWIALIGIMSFCSCGIACEHVVKKCLTIWSNIDLVRAITVDNEQKNRFLDHIAQGLLDLYVEYTVSCADPFKREQELSLFGVPNEYISDTLLSNTHVLIDSLESVKEHLHEVFHDSEQSKLDVSTFILNTLINALKDPSNIKGN